MGILTGRDEGVKLIAHADFAFVGTLTHSAKGMSTRSLPPTDQYTLEFEKFDQLRGSPIDQDEPNFHYMQTGSSGLMKDPKTQKLVPAPEPKRPKVGQFYLALLNDPRQIIQLVEITEDDIDSLRQPVDQKSH